MASVSKAKKARTGLNPVNAWARAEQFKSDGMYRYCCHAVDFVRMDTIKDHVASKKHTKRRADSEARQKPAKHQATMMSMMQAKESRQEFVEDFVKMMMMADIPFEKLEKIRPFLRKHTKQEGTIPTASVSRRTHLGHVFECHELAVKEFLQSPMISLIVDETTDSRDKSVLNIVAGVHGKYVLIDVIFLDKCNHTTLSQSVVKCLGHTCVNDEVIILQETSEKSKIFGIPCQIPPQRASDAPTSPRCHEVEFMDVRCHISRQAYHITNRLSNWCHLNRLTINIKKTKVVQFPASKCTRLNINLTLDDQPLVSQNNYRYLGIELDHDLSLKTHVTQVNKLASNKLYLLRKIRPYLSTKASVDICKTMLLPVMDYGGLFLTMCTKKELDDLQIIQNNAIRCCLKVQDPRDIHLIEMHDITHISFTDDRRLKQLLMCIWRNLSSNFLNYDNAEQQTRATQAPIMRLPIPRTEALKKSAYYKGCSYWNILPFEVRKILDQRAFKKAITVLITQGHFRR